MNPDAVEPAAPEVLRFAYVHDLVAVARKDGGRNCVIPFTCALVVTPKPAGHKTWGVATVVDPANAGPSWGHLPSLVDSRGNVDLVHLAAARIGPDAPEDGYWFSGHGVESAIIELTAAGWATLSLVMLPGFTRPPRAEWPGVAAAPEEKPKPKAKRRRRKKPETVE